MRCRHEDVIMEAYLRVVGDSPCDQDGSQGPQCISRCKENVSCHDILVCMRARTDPLVTRGMGRGEMPLTLWADSSSSRPG